MTFGGIYLKTVSKMNSISISPGMQPGAVAVIFGVNVSSTDLKVVFATPFLHLTSLSNNTPPVVLNVTEPSYEVNMLPLLSRMLAMMLHCAFPSAIISGIPFPSLSGALVDR